MEPIKRQRKESDSVYTIMLIPHKGHEPRSIHFRLSLLKKVGIVCGLLCLLGAGVLFQFFAYFVQGTSGSTGTVDLQE